MSHFHILYALDDNYAPFCGVSVTSLFENNKMIPDITVHVIGHDISQDNCRKLFSIGEKFGREIILYNADDIVGKIKDFNMPLYRGSYATNIRLFFADIIDMDSDRLLYLDSDTLVVGSLEELVSYDFKGNICAAVQESLGQHYKKLIGFAPGDVYFNAGVLLIHIPSWKNEKCSMRILNYLSQTQSRPANNDQDIINILLKEKIATLSLRYNFQPTHRVYPFKDYVDVYHPVGYYSDREVKEASLHPVVLHTYRFIGQFPWHQDTLHPDIELFDEYLSRSPWAGYHKANAKRSWILQIERVLYKILPKRWFLAIFEKAQYWYFWKITQDFKK